MDIDDTQHKQQISIEVESLEAWWGTLYEWSTGWAPGLYHRPGLTPEQLAQWQDVYRGRKYLKTPDGHEWWVPVSGWLGNDWSGEMRPIHGDPVLQDYVVDHVVDAEHDKGCEVVGDFCPMMLFDRHTNDPGRVFCMQCGQFVSLCVVGR